MNSQHWIAGTWTGQPAIESLDPATGEPLGLFADGGERDMAAAIAAAREAFDRTTWAQNPRLRQHVLLAWADRLEAKAEELAILLTRENGKVIAQSRGEIAGSISEIRYYAGLARHIPGHVLEVEPGTFSTMLREPAGVAGLIVPWNAPAVLLVRALGPALAAGCTAVVKPAKQTVLFSAAMLRELDRADVPKGVVNMVAETEHAGAALLASSHDVDVICFTGSTATGKKVMAAATDSIKKLSLELGGKSCCLVFDDADIADVAGKIATAATIISGQQCTAARRVLVHESRANAMREALTATLANLRVGSGLDTANHMGPLIDHKARTVVARQIEEACTAADRVLLRGSRLNGARAKGSFLTPTLVQHRDTMAPFCQEEIFGPFVVLETFADESEAVARANHTVFGLSASVWTHDIGRAMRVARALRDGTVWINDHNKLFAEAETGGYRQSGLGRLHGYEALADFTETKHIYLSAGVVPPR